MVETLSDISSSREAATSLPQDPSVKVVYLSVPQVERVRDPNGDMEAKLIKSDFVQRLMNSLTPPERIIISLHFGLNYSNPPVALQEIADMYFMPKKAMRELEKAALTKMRKASRRM
jgi:DNA-directed RNA polymerase sigma subunit (sigma70/sigma32)